MNLKGFLTIAIAAAIASSGVLGAWQSAASGIAPPEANVTYTSGNWWVESQEWLNDTIAVHTGNIFVNATGKLELRNATLRLNCTVADGQYRIEVRNGGALYVNDTDANPTTAADASVLTNSGSAAYGFVFQVNASATFEMRNSVLRNCGILVATAGASTSGATMRSDNVTITGSEIYGCANGLVIDSCNAIIDGCIVRDNGYNGVLVANASDASSDIVLNISDSIVRSNILNGIAVSASVFSGSFENSNISSNGGAGVRIVAWESSNVTFLNNVIGYNAYGGVGIWGQPAVGLIISNFTGNNISHNAGAPPVWIGFDPAHYLAPESPSREVSLEFSGNNLWTTNSDYGYIHVAASDSIFANATGNTLIDPSIGTGAYFGKLTEDFMYEDVPAVKELALNFSDNDVKKADGLALLACSTDKLAAVVDDNTITSDSTSTTCVVGAISIGFIKAGMTNTTPKFADVAVRGNYISNVLTGGAIGVKAVYELNASVENNTIINAVGFGIKLGWIDDSEYYDDPEPWSLPARSVRATVSGNTVSGSKSGPGIWIYSSDGSTVHSNQIYQRSGTGSYSPGDGIRIQSDVGATDVCNNTVASCALSGIRLFNASGVSVYDNTMTNNLYGLGMDAKSRGNTFFNNTVSKTAVLYGYYLATDSLDNDIHTNNTVVVPALSVSSHLKIRVGLAGAPGALVPVTGLAEQVPLMSNLGQIVIGDSRYLNVSGLSARNGTAGICLVNVTDSLVRDNNASSNTASSGFGIDLRLASSRNIISENSLASNTRGIGFNLASGENELWSNTVTKTAAQTGLYFDGSSKLIANRIPANNTVSGCPISYVHSTAWSAITGAAINVPLMTNLGQVFAYNVTVLTIENVTVSGTSATDGIRLEFCDSVNIVNATVSGGLANLHVIDCAALLMRSSSFTGGVRNIDLVRVSSASMEETSADAGIGLIRLESSNASSANGSALSATGIPIELVGSSRLSLRNTTFQRSGVAVESGSWLNVSWYLSIQATCNGQDFGVCGIEISNSTWEGIFSGNTDLNGSLTGLELREFLQESPTNVTHFNPYWVNVTKPGYGETSVLVAMDGTTHLVANLSDLSPPATSLGPTVSPSTAPTSADGAWLNFTADDSASGNGTIAGAECAVSPTAPSANGTGIAMLPADGAFDSSNESFAAFIATNGWDAGTYTLWAHARDAAGNWGPWLSAHLTITDDIGPRVVSGPAAEPDEISSETATMWLNLTIDDTGFGGSNVVGCGLSVADDAGSLAAALYVYDVAAADGSLDESNESLSLAIDVSLWSLGRHALTVWGIDSAGNLGQPATMNVTVVDRTPPASPTGLSLSNQSGNGTLLLIWSGVSNADLAGYTIYRSYLSGRSYAAMGNVSRNTTTWLDTGLTHGVKYYYTVAAFDNASEPNVSPLSAEVWGTPATPADGGGDGNETDDVDDDNVASSNWPYIVVIIAVIAAALAVVFIYRRKKHSQE